jgi:hypothetical protein
LNAKIDSTQFPGRLPKCTRDSFRGVRVFRIPLRNIGKWRWQKERYRPVGVAGVARSRDELWGLEFELQMLTSVFGADKRMSSRRQVV